MKFAVISDIHSNKFALEAVLSEVKLAGIEKLIVLGDVFGYYAWASETYDLLKPFLAESLFIKGNHDQLLLDENPPLPIPSYWDMAKQNETELREKNPEALSWLAALDFKKHVNLEGKSVFLFHGSPNDPVNGRFYPDSEIKNGEYAALGDVVLQGHTHYPLLKRTANGTVIFNPGSVGQPRDGDPNPSWAIVDFQKMEFQHKRTPYDFSVPVKILTEMNWDVRAIAALQKKHSGKLM